MDELFPPRGPATVIDDAELERIYRYPESADRSWLRVNFVSSADGAVSVGGRSHGLSSAADKRLFALIRDLAEVILVGSGTALAEGYKGVRNSEVRADRRARLGLPPVPPIAVVTRRASVPLDSGLLTDTAVPPIIVTCAAAPADRRRALAEAGADVLVAGADDVDLSAALAGLADRGLRRVSCEGGPTLFGALIAADLVDELCLSLSPLLAGGDADRIAHGPLPATPHRFTLASTLLEDDMLFLRYLRADR